VGPEGGFAPDEVEALALAGAKVCTLGPRILRTETAGLVLLSMIGYKWGDLG
ncbi:MAG: RsmE family RNA methyltransferase, partial [Limnochordia bacterium]|nr:RsmE family RNA methyltransferase [Limnochordia bacterium]